ncbi:MAG: hypothetical protein GIW95_05625 [Candidatus Eremiobacteraeota bacterium]|nr:hypothetical protein [Candidatus Eremiobacteraeota bacterium]
MTVAASMFFNEAASTLPASVRRRDTIGGIRVVVLRATVTNAVAMLARRKAFA